MFISIKYQEIQHFYPAVTTVGGGGALRFAAVSPSVRPSVRSSHFTVSSLCNQRFPEFSMDLFETLLTCCGHNESVHVGFDGA